MHVGAWLGYAKHTSGNARGETLFKNCDDFNILLSASLVLGNREASRANLNIDKGILKSPPGSMINCIGVLQKQLLKT